MKDNYCSDIFNSLEENGVSITQEEKEKIYEQLNRIMDYEPKVGVFGKTGVGKSSLCNALFGKDICPISDVEACTRNPKEVLIKMGDNNRGIILVDVPGVGENSDRDEEYAKLYAELLPQLDLVLWVLKADDRAMSTDENFYKNIVKPHIEQGKPFFFVINQVDKIEPTREWNYDIHEPSNNQFNNIDKKEKAIATMFDVAKSNIVSVSATEKYNLVELVDEFIRALPTKQKFTTYRAVNEEFRSEATGEHVRKSLLDVIENVVCTTVEVAGKVIEKAFDTVVELVSSGGSWILDKITGLFS